MDLKVDEERFDNLQPWFVGEIIELLKEGLDKAAVPEDRSKEICGEMAFSICVLIDGSAPFTVEGESYVPILAFADKDNTTFYPGRGSNLHEYAFGVVDEIFDTA